MLQRLPNQQVEVPAVPDLDIEILSVATGRAGASAGPRGHAGMRETAVPPSGPFGTGLRQYRYRYALLLHAA